MTKAATTLEVVLPSGAFARFEDLRARHYIAATMMRAANPDRDLIPLLISLTCKIDDKPVSYEHLEEMDIRDYMAVQAALCKYLELR